MFTVDSFTQSPAKTIIQFREVTNPEGAQALIDQAVYVSATDVMIDSTERYAVGDIIGCRVVSAESSEHLPGMEIGAVSDVLLLPANDVWVVTRGNGEEVLLPVVESVIKQVDLHNRVIRVHLIPGLVDSPWDESRDE